MPPPDRDLLLSHAFTLGSRKVCFFSDDEIVYRSGNAILFFSMSRREQVALRLEPGESLDSFCVIHRLKVIVVALHSSSQCEIRVYRHPELERPLLLSIPYDSVFPFSHVTASRCGSMIAAVGSAFHHKVCVWNLSGAPLAHISGAGLGDFMADSIANSTVAATSAAGTAQQSASDTGPAQPSSSASSAASSSLLQPVELQLERNMRVDDLSFNPYDPEELLTFSSEAIHVWRRETRFGESQIFRTSITPFTALTFINSSSSAADAPLGSHRGSIRRSLSLRGAAGASKGSLLAAANAAAAAAAAAASASSGSAAASSRLGSLQKGGASSLTMTGVSIDPTRRFVSFCWSPFAPSSLIVATQYDELLFLSLSRSAVGVIYDANGRPIQPLATNSTSAQSQQQQSQSQSQQQGHAQSEGLGSRSASPNRRFKGSAGDPDHDGKADGKGKGRAKHHKTAGNADADGDLSHSTHGTEKGSATSSARGKHGRSSSAGGGASGSRNAADGAALSGGESAAEAGKHHHDGKTFSSDDENENDGEDKDGVADGEEQGAGGQGPRSEHPVPTPHSGPDLRLHGLVTQGLSLVAGQGVVQATAHCVLLPIRLGSAVLTLAPGPSHVLAGGSNGCVSWIAYSEMHACATAVYQSHDAKDNADRAAANAPHSAHSASGSPSPSPHPRHVTVHGGASPHPHSTKGGLASASSSSSSTAVVVADANATRSHLHAQHQYLPQSRLVLPPLRPAHVKLFAQVPIISLAFGPAYRVFVALDTQGTFYAGSTTVQSDADDLDAFGSGNGNSNPMGQRYGDSASSSSGSDSSSSSSSSSSSLSGGNLRVHSFVLTSLLPTVHPAPPFTVRAATSFTVPSLQNVCLNTDESSALRGGSTESLLSSGTTTSMPLLSSSSPSNPAHVVPPAEQAWRFGAGLSPLPFSLTPLGPYPLLAIIRVGPVSPLGPTDPSTSFASASRGDGSSNTSNTTSGISSSSNNSNGGAATGKVPLNESVWPELRIIHMRSRTYLSRFPFPPSETPLQVCSSADGLMVAVGFASGFVRILDVSDPAVPRCIFSERLHTGAVGALQFSPAAPYLASLCAESAELVFLRYVTTRSGRSADPHHGSSSTSSFAKDSISPNDADLGVGSAESLEAQKEHNRNLAAGVGLGFIVSFELAGVTPVLPQCTCMSWLPVDQEYRLFIGTALGYALILCAPSTLYIDSQGRSRHRVPEGPGSNVVLSGKVLQPILCDVEVAPLAFAPDPHTARGFFVMCADKILKSFVLEDTLQMGGSASHQGVGSYADTVELGVGGPACTALSARWRNNYPGHMKPGSVLAMSPNGELIASGGRDGLIVVRRVKDMPYVVTCAAHDPAVGGVQSLAFSTNSAMLFSSGRDGGVLCWNVSNVMPALSSREALPRLAPVAVFLQQSWDGRSGDVDGIDGDGIGSGDEEHDDVDDDVEVDEFSRKNRTNKHHNGGHEDIDEDGGSAEDGGESHGSSRSAPRNRGHRGAGGQSSLASSATSALVALVTGAREADDEFESLVKTVCTVAPALQSTRAFTQAELRVQLSNLTSSLSASTSSSSSSSVSSGIDRPGSGSISSSSSSALVSLPAANRAGSAGNSKASAMLFVEKHLREINGAVTSAAATSLPSLMRSSNKPGVGEGYQDDAEVQLDIGSALVAIHKRVEEMLRANDAAPPDERLDRAEFVVDRDALKAARSNVASAAERARIRIQERNLGRALIAWRMKAQFWDGMMTHGLALAPLLPANSGLLGLAAPGQLGGAATTTSATSGVAMTPMASTTMAGVGGAVSAVGSSLTHMAPTPTANAGMVGSTMGQATSSSSSLSTTGASMSASTSTVVGSNAAMWGRSGREVAMFELQRMDVDWAMYVQQRPMRTSNGMELSTIKASSSLPSSSSASGLSLEVVDSSSEGSSQHLLQKNAAGGVTSVGAAAATSIAATRTLTTYDVDGNVLPHDSISTAFKGVSKPLPFPHFTSFHSESTPEALRSPATAPARLPQMNAKQRLRRILFLARTEALERVWYRTTAHDVLLDHTGATSGMAVPAAPPTLFDEVEAASDASYLLHNGDARVSQAMPRRGHNSSASHSYDFATITSTSSSSAGASVHSAGKTSASGSSSAMSIGGPGTASAASGASTTSSATSGVSSGAGMAGAGAGAGAGTANSNSSAVGLTTIIAGGSGSGGRGPAGATGAAAAAGVTGQLVATGPHVLVLDSVTRQGLERLLAEGSEHTVELVMYPLMSCCTRLRKITMVHLLMQLVRLRKEAFNQRVIYLLDQKRQLIEIIQHKFVRVNELQHDLKEHREREVIIAMTIAAAAAQAASGASAASANMSQRLKAGSAVNAGGGGGAGGMGGAGGTLPSFNFGATGSNTISGSAMSAATHAASVAASAAAAVQQATNAAAAVNAIGIPITAEQCCLQISERPEAVITVDESEITAEPLATAEATAARKRAEAANKAQQDAAQDMDRGLHSMMYGVLEAKKGTSVADLIVQRPDWMVATSPEVWTDEQRVQAMEIERRERMGRVEREAKARLLEAELKRLRSEILDTCKGFDSQVRAALSERIACARRIYADEVVILGLAKEVEEESRVAGLLIKSASLIESLRDAQSTKETALLAFRRQVAALQKRMDALVQEDRTADRAVRREIADPAIASTGHGDFFWRLYKHGPSALSTHPTAMRRPSVLPQDIGAGMSSMGQRRGSSALADGLLQDGLQKEDLVAMGGQTGTATRRSLSRVSMRSAGSGNEDHFPILPNGDNDMEGESLDPFASNKLMYGITVPQIAVGRAVQQQASSSPAAAGAATGSNALGLSHADRPHDVDPLIWTRLEKRRAEKVARDTQLAAHMAEMAGMHHHLSTLEASHNAIYNQLVALEKAVRHTERAERRRMLDARVALRVIQGNVELGDEHSPIIPDLDDALLLPTIIISEQNAQIIASGEANVQLLYAICRQRSGLRIQQWDRKRLEFVLRDTEAAKQDVQMMRITKSLQQVIKAGGVDSRRAAEVSVMERKADHIKTLAEEEIAVRMHTLQRLKRKANDLAQENVRLERATAKLDELVGERQQVLGLRDQSASGTTTREEVVQRITQRRKVVSYIAQQHIDISKLRDEVERLRSKTFPSFVLPALPDAGSTAGQAQSPQSGSGTGQGSLPSLLPPPPKPVSTALMHHEASLRASKSAANLRNIIATQYQQQQQRNAQHHGGKEQLQGSASSLSLTIQSTRHLPSSASNPSLMRPLVGDLPDTGLSATGGRGPHSRSTASLLLQPVLNNSPTSGAGSGAKAPIKSGGGGGGGGMVASTSSSALHGPSNSIGNKVLSSSASTPALPNIYARNSSYETSSSTSSSGKPTLDLSISGTNALSARRAPN